MTILDRWKITAEELTDLIDANPSLRGMMLGYVAELQIKKYFANIPDITYLGKGDDHDRASKGDCLIAYKGAQFKVEVKSLQTNSIKILENAGQPIYTGKTQVDASDRREVQLPDGSVLNTTCLLRGEFEMLAVNCFAFNQEWRFVFAKNTDLPTSNYSKYTDYQKQHLIATLIPVSLPAEAPFYENPIPVLEALISGS